MTKSNSEKIKKIEMKTLKKYLISKWVFITLNLTGIAIAALIVILNLYAIRWNERPSETMHFFVQIALISAFTTFFLGVQAFLNISNKKAKTKQNIQKIEEIINILEKKENIEQEDLDNISEVL
ncbi:hypothetical protein MCANUFG4_00758 [Mycoplasmopsis canis UFG4]|uniref:Uncharacterized protein n=1 Tax=Mycoplasmopsis canis UFG4 TaxID=1131455 RepID=I1A6J9_9BACT|nr:hypothetical protein [Mycoplasmopsis canis]AKF41246.1 hypothetical protein AAW50_02310 [Mycoplasmopsis canis]EIE42120.1 hypothetical protein MCANUFG4_00758 [Mycoplasmopsis canis UFG4]